MRVEKDRELDLSLDIRLRNRLFKLEIVCSLSLRRYCLQTRAKEKEREKTGESRSVKGK